MNKELLRKYCRNQCTKEDLDSILSWFNESITTTTGRSYLLEIWEELRDDDIDHEINFEFLLDKIHHEINLTETGKPLQRVDREIDTYNKRGSFMTMLTRAAAILLLPALGFAFYMSFKYQSIRSHQASLNIVYNEVFSSVDAITKVTLPDGSRVWLNRSSSLRYPAVFLENVRTVNLNGEGYFEVVSNSEAPFIVNTGEMQVKALGTTFNIMAYPDEDKIETSLITGRVELQRIGPDGTPIPLLEIKPTDVAFFERSTSKISTSTILDDRNYSWRDGKLVFDRAPMSEVVKKLSRWFNVDIHVADPEVLDFDYTATFVNESLPQAMELIAMVSPVSYSILNRQVVSPGIFTKRKVILSYSNK